jgi:hypothetical protein
LLYRLSSISIDLEDITPPSTVDNVAQSGQSDGIFEMDFKDGRELDNEQAANEFRQHF